MLGSDVVSELEAAHYQVLPLTKQDLDITDSEKVKEIIYETEPEFVINCAAYTNVDLAEKETTKAISVNGFGPSSISKYSAKVGATVVHISTDYVFDGEKMIGPYVESDKPKPISAYGASKFAGEQMVVAKNPKHFIVRTAGLYGANGNNFVKAIVRAANERGHLEVVSDQFTNPTSTKSLSEAIIELIKTEDYGIYHLAASGACSWYEFAQEIMAIEETNVPIKQISNEQLERAAKRPIYSVLSSEKPNTPKMEYWRNDLKQYMANRSNYITELEQV